MIIKGHKVPVTNGRKPYPLQGHQVLVKHFVVRITTPDNPFHPHAHEVPEFWYIIEGQALVQLGNEEYAVEGGDLIVIESWVKHGLRTTSQATWICLG